MTTQLYTVKEAAKLLSVGTATVNRLLASGKLPRVKIGRATRIKGDDIDALVKASIKVK